MATFFKEVIEEPQFIGRFRIIAFGIVSDPADGQGLNQHRGENFAAFADVFGLPKSVD